jgi:uncharacterized membrane protein
MDAVAMLNLVQKTITVAPEERNVGTADRIISSAAGILLGYTAIKNFRKGGFTFLLPAGYLLWRASSGYCPLYNLAGINTRNATEPFEFNKTITIHRNKVEVYNFWRRLENLPMIMKHIKNVDKVSNDKYKWEAEFNNRIFRWNARIIEDIPNERIIWTTSNASDIRNTGTVEFSDAPKNKGTQMTVSMYYTPAHSKTGRMIAGFLDPLFSQMVKDDLKRFKHMMESEDYSYEKSAMAKMKSL